MKSPRALFTWPWFHGALAGSLIAPWPVYALAGYIEADSQIQLANYRTRWMDPGSHIILSAAITVFVVVILIGLAVESFRRQSQARP